MELDDVKSILNSKLDSEASTRSPEELSAYFNRKTISILGKIKRNMWFELKLTSIIVIAFAIIYVLYSSLYMRFFMVFTAIFCIIFSVYIYSLYRKIIRFEQSSFTVKENLQQVIAILDRFAKIYYQVSMALLPLVFVLGIIVGYIDIRVSGLEKSFHYTRGLIFYFVWFLFWSVIMYFFTRWYIKKLYGKYITQLKNQLIELENG
jgi:hypothetical protein